MTTPKLTHIYKKNKLEQLKTFCIVVECDSNITKAAEILCISPSSVSLQIQSLENELKKELFDRRSKRLYLNQNGMEYYQQAKDAVNAINTTYKIDKGNTKSCSKRQLIIMNVLKRLREGCKFFIRNKKRSLLSKFNKFKNYLLVLSFVVIGLMYLTITNKARPAKMIKELKTKYEISTFSEQKDIIYHSSNFVINSNYIILKLLQEFNEIYVIDISIYDYPSPIWANDIKFFEKIYFNNKNLSPKEQLKKIADANIRAMQHLKMIQYGKRYTVYNFYTHEPLGEFYDKARYYFKTLNLRKIKSLPYKTGTYRIIIDTKRKNYYLIYDTGTPQVHNLQEDRSFSTNFSEKPMHYEDLIKIDNGKFLYFLEKEHLLPDIN